MYQVRLGMYEGSNHVKYSSKCFNYFFKLSTTYFKYFYIVGNCAY